ncbi:hypothetical protein AUC69_12345 [Methyloceanibacter superfactus]|uniref:Uncharacterized protein n=1 Tax=Methyloceanibacter superfactus TaxID=1774969 RepID=A0A1E3VV51_9HYPH|nr:ABC transporter ATP-binding protein [Methyloceanibacter superfactus]ODR97395.1 hypothetical protein AUC69_12345 [Methyloceanibacter superfactus]
MTESTIKRGVNYWSTYVLLVKDYVAFLGAKAIPVLGGVVVAGLLSPLPFAIMAAAIYAMMAGHHTSVIKFSRWKTEVGVDSAFLYSLILAGVTLTFNYFTARLSLKATTAWQTSLLWRAVNQLPVMARWDTETAIPMPLRLERLGSFLNSIIRSAFLVGRIVAIGLSNFVIATGALIVLTWLDPISVLVLILMAILCLPLYAWALLGLVGVRQQGARNRQLEQAMFKQVLQGVVSSSGRRIDTSQMTAEAARRFDSGYGMVNAQLQGLNLVSLILSLHVFASIAVIYLINGASLSSFLRDKIVFFVVLLFMMKAALGLALLISRLSRNYTSLATLRAYLHPRRKGVSLIQGMPADAVFSLTAGEAGEHHPLRPGRPVFVVMPMAARAFELLPLSNALDILKKPTSPVLRHIVFLDTPELEALVDGGTPQAPDTTMQIGDKKQILHLPIRHTALELEQLGIVALTRNAWEHLVASDEAENFCRQRIVFVVVAEPKRPKPPSPETLLVVSDGVDILAVGPFAEIWERAADEAFQRAAKKDIKIDFSEDEEMA